MNVGYGKFTDDELNNQVCPICGKDIYVAKRRGDFACADIDCPLGHGAKELYEKLDKIFNLMD